MSEFLKNAKSQYLVNLKARFQNAFFHHQKSKYTYSFCNNEHTTKTASDKLKQRALA